MLVSSWQNVGAEQPDGSATAGGCATSPQPAFTRSLFLFPLHDAVQSPVLLSNVIVDVMASR